MAHIWPTNFQTATFRNVETLGSHNAGFASPVSRAESKATPKGTGYSMTIGAFDLDEFLADLRSDEGVDPAMSIVPMPPWWIEALVMVFAARNRR